MTKLIPSFAQIGIAALVLLSFGLRLCVFQETPYVTGWDGYFYLIQVQSLLETGAMHTTDSSLIYPFLLVWVKLIGDYVLAFKVVAALLSSVFVGLTCWLGWRFSKRWEVALLLGSWFVFSPHLTYFAAQYPKNLLGLIFFLGLMLVLSFFEKSPRKYSILILFSMLILNYFGHRMTFVCSVGLLVAWSIFRWFNWKWWLGSLVVGVGFILTSSLFSGVLNLSDLDRFDGMFTLELQFAVWSFYQSFSEVNLLSFSWKFEIFSNVILLVSAGLYIAKQWFLGDYKEDTNIDVSFDWSLFYANLLLVYGLLFPFFKWSLVGFSYRLVLVFFLITPIVTIFIAKEFSKKILIGLSFILVSSSFYSIQSYQPKKHDAPYLTYEKATKKTLQKIPATSIELLIAHNSLAEYFTFTTHIDALPWLPEYTIDSTQLWRIATDIRPNQLEYYLTPQQQKLTHRLTVQYFLIREDVWQFFLKEVKKDNDIGLLNELQTWRNPHCIRPGFLLKLKE